MTPPVPVFLWLGLVSEKYLREMQTRGCTLSLTRPRGGAGCLRQLNDPAQASRQDKGFFGLLISLLRHTIKAAESPKNLLAFCEAIENLLLIGKQMKANDRLTHLPNDLRKPKHIARPHSIPWPTPPSSPSLSISGAQNVSLCYRAKP